MAELQADARDLLLADQVAGRQPWPEADLASAQTRQSERDTARQAWQTKAPADRRRQQDGRSAVNPSHSLVGGGGLADWWYLDDGDLLLDPALVLPTLRCFDRAGRPRGSIRNKGKMEVILYASPAELQAKAEEWHLQELADECQLKDPLDGVVTLGVVTGPEDKVIEQLREKANVARAMHTELEIIDDPATQHVLANSTLGINKITHLLRVHGASIAAAQTHDGNGIPDAGPLDAIDRTSRQTQDHLFPGLSELGYQQAALGVAVGGLGWRRATKDAVPANLAALTTSAPLVRWMAQDLESAGLAPAGAVLAQLAHRQQQARLLYEDSLADAERPHAARLLQAAELAAAANWENLKNGLGRNGIEAPSFDPRTDLPGIPERQEPAGDPRKANPRGRASEAAHLQRQLCRIRDLTSVRSLESDLQAEGRWAQWRRLCELRDRGVSHDWLWHLDPTLGPVMTGQDYTIGVRRRLGARFLATPSRCPCCGEVLDVHLEHSETCSGGAAKAANTRGHYAVRDSYLGGVKLADAGAQVEVSGLTESQSKPADILTSAASPGRRAALDIGITSPNSTTASQGGGDAVAAMHRRKAAKYAPDRSTLRAANIVYQPLIWSADGRPHPAVRRAMAYTASVAGHIDPDMAAGGPQRLLQRWRHSIAVALGRRRAAIARAVLPWDRDRSLAHGTPDDDAETAAPLEDDPVFDWIEDDGRSWASEYEL